MERRCVTFKYDVLCFIYLLCWFLTKSGITNALVVSLDLHLESLQGSSWIKRALPCNLCSYAVQHLLYISFLNIPSTTVEYKFSYRGTLFSSLLSSLFFTSFPYKVEH